MTIENITAEAEALLDKLAKLGRQARNHGELREPCRLAHRQIEEAYLHAQARGDEDAATYLADISAALEGWIEVLR